MKKVFVWLILGLLAGCAKLPDGAVLIKSGMGGIYGYSDNPETNQLLHLNDCLTSRNYFAISDFCLNEKFDSSEKQLYLSNLCGEVFTYHKVDYQAAIETNETLYQSCEDLGDKYLGRLFQTDFDLVVKHGAASRAFGLAVSPLVVLMDAGDRAAGRTPIGAGKVAEGSLKGYHYYEWDTYTSGGREIDSDLKDEAYPLHDYLDLTLLQIKNNAAYRLSYLYGKIGDTEQAQQWKDKASD